MTPLFAALSGLLLLSSVAQANDAERYPPAGESSTDHGRSVWIANCEGCHAYGIAGSPNPFKPDDWRSRVSKSRSTLYQHAIGGFFGPEDTHMPPRGGNDDLSDSDVKSAVDYMIELALQTINSKENS